MFAQYLKHIPEHMHESAITWFTRGEPHPDLMGSFLRAVLANDLVKAATCADRLNQRALFGWAMVLANAPRAAWGSEAALLAWHELHHMSPEARATLGDAARQLEDDG